MRKLFLSTLMAVCLYGQGGPAPATPPQPAPPKAAARAVAPRQPKLVLAIAIDQFRYDYLTRFRSEYTGGLKRLLEKGAVFTNANYNHFPTVTGIGHSTFLSGATPALSGIAGNTWYERERDRTVAVIQDDQEKQIGGKDVGASPRNMLQSTVGDELKMSGKGGKVIGVSIKARSAILPAGHSADAAYWFDGPTGELVSSTYYFKDGKLPRWAEEFNQAKLADKYLGTTWLGHRFAEKSGPAFYSGIEASPVGNEMIQQASLKVLKEEKLGTGSKIDLLAVSYSANDYVGHAYGPDSPEVHDMAVRVDKLIGELIAAAEAQSGAGTVVTVLTADHGVSPTPEANRARKMPGGRVPPNDIRDLLEKTLTARFGNGPWVKSVAEGIYLNPQLLADPKFNAAEVEQVAADALRKLPYVFRAYTRTDLMKGNIGGDPVDIRVRNGFYAPRSGDVILLLKPYYITSAANGTGASHGAPFSFDTHVPMIFMGPHIKPGRYNQNVIENDIAPTLATLLDVETPSGSVGRVLDEILQ